MNFQPTQTLNLPETINQMIQGLELDVNRELILKILLIVKLSVTMIFAVSAFLVTNVYVCYFNSGVSILFSVLTMINYINFKKLQNINIKTYDDFGRLISEINGSFPPITQNLINIRMQKIKMVRTDFL